MGGSLWGVSPGLGGHQVEDVILRFTGGGGVTGVGGCQGWGSLWLGSLRVGGSLWGVSPGLGVTMVGFSKGWGSPQRVVIRVKGPPGRGVPMVCGVSLSWMWGVPMGDGGPNGMWGVPMKDGGPNGMWGVSNGMWGVPMGDGGSGGLWVPPMIHGCPQWDVGCPNGRWGSQWYVGHP